MTAVIGIGPHLIDAITGGTPVFRQGDLLIVQAELPRGGKKRKAQNGRHILAYGEQTGHHHSVGAATCELIETKGAEAVFLKIMSATDLVHPEHGTVTIPPGTWRVSRQREYSPAALPTRVAD